MYNDRDIFMAVDSRSPLKHSDSWHLDAEEDQRRAERIRRRMDMRLSLDVDDESTRMFMDNDEPEVTTNKSVTAEAPGAETRNKKTPSPATTSQNRQIEIELLDTSNEEKFDRLLKEEKIRTPYKRRISDVGENRASSPHAMDEPNNQTTRRSDVAKKSRIDSQQSGRKREESTSSSIGTTSSKGTSSSKGGNYEYETDPAILSRRQKQIDYGKNCLSYDNYIKEVPKHLRTADSPKTPPKTHKYSRRAFDGLIKVWKKKLHVWAPKGEDGEESGNSDSDP